MYFEWDEAKRLSNIAKHGLDFADADLLFAGPHLLRNANETLGEQRSLATGLIDDVCVTAIFTKRGIAIRIISLKRARDGERKAHAQIFERSA